MSMEAMVSSTVVGQPALFKNVSMKTKKTIILVLTAVFAATALLAGRSAQSAGTEMTSLGEDNYNSMRRLRFGRRDLRVAAFGGDNTHGSALGSRYQAYQYLVSPNSDTFAGNLWSRFGNYAKVCAQSIVGDDKLYDLILVEKTHGQLIPRLRERFPSTLIVVVDMNKPHLLRRREYRPNGEMVRFETFDEWHHRVRPLNIPEAFEKDTRAKWYIPRIEGDLALEKFVESIPNCKLVRLLPFEVDIRKLLVNRWDFFHSKNSVPNADAHGYVAQTILTIAQEYEEELQAESPTSDGLAMVSSSYLGTWGKGDTCNVWLHTGNVPYAYDTNHIHMKSWATHSTFFARYGLEVAARGGWIRIKNPYDQFREFFLTMFVGEEGKFPTTKVSWVGPDGAMSSKMITPQGTEETETIPVGFLPPGVTTIHFKQQEFTQRLFLIGGVTFTNEKDEPDQTQFSKWAYPLA